jgi:ribonuclease Z
MIKVTILGNNSALPAHGRHPTAQAVEIREQVFLIDCGEATQIQMQRYNVRRKRINHIFISHLHGDHYFGLIGLITSMGLMGRTAPLYLFGPPALREIIRLHLEAGSTLLPFEIVFTPIEEGQASVLIDHYHYAVSCFPVEHRIPCHGFVLTAKGSGRRIVPERCRQLEIPAAFYNQLKKGADYLRRDGLLIKNHEVTVDGPPSVRYAFCADTRYTDSFLAYIKEADAIYHESTYLKDNAEKAWERFHCTAEQAAQIALRAGVGRLFLGHFSAKYSDLSPFLAEARSVFEATELSSEGAVFEIIAKKISG